MEREYDRLVNEVMQNLSLIHQQLGIMYSSIGIIIAYILGMNNNPLLFIAVYLILVPISAKIHLLNDANFKISSYITIFLEPHMTDLHWSTYNKIKVRIADNESGRLNKFYRTIYSLFLTSNMANFIIGIATYILFVYVLLENYSFTYLLIAGIINTFSILVLFYFLILDSNKHRAELHDTEWKKVKEYINETER